MYEYTVQEFNGDDTSAVLAWLNGGGESGWEAFSIEPMAGGYRIWLRRRRSGVAGGLQRVDTE